MECSAALRVAVGEGNTTRSSTGDTVIGFILRSSTFSQTSRLLWYVHTIGTSAKERLVAEQENTAGLRIVNTAFGPTTRTYCLRKHCPPPLRLFRVPELTFLKYVSSASVTDQAIKKDFM
jgi:hypothetical protein